MVEEETGKRERRGHKAETVVQTGRKDGWKVRWKEIEVGMMEGMRPSDININQWMKLGDGRSRTERSERTEEGEEGWKQTEENSRGLISS